MPQLQEGKTGTLPDGTRVVVQNGQIVPMQGLTPRGSATGRNEASGLSGPMPGPQSAPGAGYFGAAGARPKMFAKTEEDLLKLDAAAQAAQGRKADAARFSALNKQVGTGLGPGIPGMTKLLGMFDPRYAEMSAITEKMTPQMREAGSGAMSDRDVEMYRASIMSTGKPGPANGAMARAIQAGATREGDYNAFRNEWAKRNNTLVGSQEAWLAYANANPLYESGKDGLTAIKKTTPWREWFGLSSPAAKPPTPPAKPPASGGGWSIVR